MADSSFRNGPARLSGPAAARAPPPQAKGSAGAGEGNVPQNASTTASAANNNRPAEPSTTATTSKKKRRGGKKKKNRRKSFIAPSETTVEDSDGRAAFLDATRANGGAQASLYRLQGRANRSNTSLESEALLDHRDHMPQPTPRSRRETMKQSFARVAHNMPFSSARHSHSRSSEATHQITSVPRTSRLGHAQENAISEDEDDTGAHDRTPLLAARNRSKPGLSRGNSGFGYGSEYRNRRQSTNSKASSRRRPDLMTHPHNYDPDDQHDVNNPPSVPGSPLAGSMDDFFSSARSDRGRDRDAIVDMDDGEDLESRFSSGSPPRMGRRPTLSEVAQRDVCFPIEEDMSDHAEEESHHPHSIRRRRRRAKAWPDLEILEEWSREEKEERTHQEVLRAKKISEPVMVGGRLRPAKTGWHREEDDSPFRFTYFNDQLDGTIHARTISDLQDDMTFRELFLPDPIEDSESSSDEGDDQEEAPVTRPSEPSRPASEGNEKVPPSVSGVSRDTSKVRAPSVVSHAVTESAPGSGRATPKQPARKTERERRDSELERPTFWLDVLRPTEAEMKVLAKAFGIHQLTSEDILMEEPREKVELFPQYYFVNYRTFEQDKDSEDYMDPVNMYIIVFRTGVITFHHSLSPHPANVRRRIRQLSDYMSPSADWISYAIIDDVTDVYGPLVGDIEKEVNEIDEDILYMHTTSADNATAAMIPQPKKSSESQRPKSSKGGGKSVSKSAHWEAQSQADIGAAKAEGDRTIGESGGDMLRRIGECRKTVMGLYRLLGNKADVIKGFAKRCNEQHKVAPRSEIGLYLGDIQDHIVTMTGNLSHYESLLSRAHGNYVAQINIRMNERAEQNADVLGKLTVLGTIVLPMNIITGMWGMNVWVPGQDIEGDLTWFFSITAGLLAFGLICYFIARKVYGIV